MLRSYFELTTIKARPNRILMLSYQAEDCLFAMSQLVVCHPRNEQLVTKHRYHLPPIDVVEREMSRYRGRNEVFGSMVITPHEVDASDVAIDARNSSLNSIVYQDSTSKVNVLSTP